MFVNRESELDALRAALEAGRPGLVRVYGRRRVGKTELLRELVRRRRGLFLLADEADRPQQLESLARQIAEQTAGLRLPLRDWDDLLDQIEKSGRPFVILDEFQRLLESDRQAATRLQARWDASWRTAGPTVVLCGSSIGMMQRLTGGRRGPLFGRITADLRLRPFPYPAVRLLYPKETEEERVRRFAAFGGTPFYHSFSVGRSLKSAVEESFLGPLAPFREEPQELLRLELKSPTRYNSILYEVGQGTHYLGELETKVGVGKGGLGPYLETLRDDLDLLEMEDPVCGLLKQARYRLSDPFFAFYFRFIFANRPRLELGRISAVWQEIEKGLDGHVGRVFERVVKDILVAANGGKVGEFRIDFDEIGRWWNRPGEEIDLVARGTSEIWAIEVKWSGQPTRLDVWRNLLRKISLIEKTRGVPVRPVLACRGGFDGDVVEEARRTGGVLLAMEDLSKLADSARS